MELTESIESLNQQLIDLFGIDTISGQAIWRISWSENEYEHKRMDYSPGGIKLLFPEVFRVKKYPYIKERYVLERLVIVPEVSQSEIPASKVSYEPMWTFESATGEYLPPIIGAAKFVVDTVYASLGKTSLRKYVEDESETTPEGREQRIDKLQEELFGDESGLLGKTHLTHEGIVVPSTYKSTQEGDK
jgi:hypothetical protein